MTVLLGAVLVIGMQAAGRITSWDLDQAIRALLVAFYIFGAYYYYASFLTLYRLRPLMLWTLLAVVIGLVAAVAADAIDDGRWFLPASLAFFAAGTVVFVATLVEQARGHYFLPVALTHDAESARQMLRFELRKNTACFAVLTLAAGLAWWFAQRLAAAAGISPTLAVFSVGATLYPGMMGWTEFSFLPKVRALVQPSPGS